MSDNQIGGCGSAVLNVDVAMEVVGALLKRICDLGGKPSDLCRLLAQPRLRREVAQLIIKSPDEKIFPSSGALAEFGLDDVCEIVDDVEPLRCKISDFKVMSVLSPYEDYVVETALHARAEKNNANIGVADALRIWLNRKEIFTGQEDKIFVFTGTKLCNRFNTPFIFVFEHDNAHGWQPHARPLKGNWYSNTYFLGCVAGKES